MAIDGVVRAFDEIILCVSDWEVAKIIEGDRTTNGVGRGPDKLSKELRSGADGGGRKLGYY